MPPSDENLLRLLLDPVVFSESFIKLENPEGTAEWHLDPYQKHIMRDTTRNRAINKSKKTGISTTIAGESIHRSFTNAGRQTIFVSTGQRIAEELLGKWYDMVATLPQVLQPIFKNKTMQDCRLPNGARVMSLPSAEPAKIRGFGMRGPMTDVYADEYAHVSNDGELWVVVKDFQILGGHITLNSTPKGKRGRYYQIVEPLQTYYRGLAPRPKEAEWGYHEIPYTACPRLMAQEKFLKEGMTDIDFKQEYCCEFIDESLSFFPYELVWSCQKTKSFVSSGYKTHNPIYFGIDFGQRISETIVYVVEEISPETFITLYIEEMPGVNYDDQVDVITLLAREFNPAMIKIDATGPGGQTMLDLLSSEKNCGPGIVYGYNLSSTVKENIIIRLRMLMQRKKLEIPMKELSPFGEKLEMQLHSIQRTSTEAGLHTRYSGKATGMDDMTWALALATYKEFTVEFDPIIVMHRDDGLENISRILKSGPSRSIE